MKFQIGKDKIEAQLGFDQMTISGDSSKGYRPVELLVSSLASCSGAVFRTILEKQRISFTQITIEADVKRVEQEANRVEEITLHFNLWGENLNEERLKRNLRIVRRNCGMMRSVEKSIIIKETITVHPA